MLTKMIHAKIKQEMLDEYIDLIRILSQKTTKKGCHFYAFNQRQDIPTEFVLYEQWENQEAIENHMKELFEILGPARHGEPAPAKLLDMYEEATPVFYNIIG